MLTKDFLNQPRKLQSKIDRQLALIKEWDIRSLSTNGPRYGEESVSGTRNRNAPFEKWVVKIVDMEREIEKECLEMTELKEKVMNAIFAHVVDPDIVSVLSCRYLKLMPFSEIVTETGLGRSTVYSLHEKGLEMMQEGEPYEDENR